MKKIEKNRVAEEWFKIVTNIDIKTVQKMIKKGIDVNIKNRHGWTALHFACSHWGDIEMAKLLVDSGADIDIKNSSLRTPLHFACYWGEIGVIKLLIDGGATITARDVDGETPLDKLKRDKQQYEGLIQWVAEHHPDKALEYMAKENIQSKGVIFC